MHLIIYLYIHGTQMSLADRHETFASFNRSKPWYQTKESFRLVQWKRRRFEHTTTAFTQIIVQKKSCRMHARHLNTFTRKLNTLTKQCRVMTQWLRSHPMSFPTEYISFYKYCYASIQIFFFISLHVFISRANPDRRVWITYIRS